VGELGFSPESDSRCILKKNLHNSVLQGGDSRVGESGFSPESDSRCILKKNLHNSVLQGGDSRVGESGFSPEKRIVLKNKKHHE